MLLRYHDVNYLSQRRFFASKLAEVGQYQAAAHILESIHAPNDLIKIKLLLDAASYRFKAHNFKKGSEIKAKCLNLLDNLKLRISTDTYNHFQETISNLENLKSQKRKSKRKLRIVIVGNSPMVNSYNFGDSIDSFDIIVRCNNFVLEGYKKFVGSKTDFVFITPACMPNKLLFDIPGFKINCLCIGAFQSEVAAQERMNRDNGVQLSISDLCIISDNYISELISDIGLEYGKWPSSGILAIDWFLKIFDSFPCEYQLFYHGFSFYKESSKGLKHYFPVTTKRDDVHDFILESRYLKKLQCSKQVKSLLSSQNHGDLFLISHYPSSRKSSPCTSVYWGILNGDIGYDVHHIQSYKSDINNELEKIKNVLMSRNTKSKIIFLFNGINSFLLSESFLLGLKSLLKVYGSSSCRVGVYWHETAWNAKRFLKDHSVAWGYMKDIWSCYSKESFHLVPTSQNKQIVMYLTPADDTKIRVVFEASPVDNDLISPNRASTSNLTSL